MTERGFAHWQAASSMWPLHHQAAIAMRHDRLADSVRAVLLIASAPIIIFSRRVGEYAWLNLPSIMLAMSRVWVRWCGSGAKRPLPEFESWRTVVSALHHRGTSAL